MNSLRFEVLEYCEGEYGTVPDYPWMKWPDNAVLRHDNGGKWYGIIMPVRGAAVGSEAEYVDVLNVKLPPETVSELVCEKGFAPAYHMNKVHWITIRLDGSVSVDKISELIDVSFEMTMR